MEHSVHHVVFLVIMSGCMAANRDCTEENVDVRLVHFKLASSISG